MSRIIKCLAIDGPCQGRTWESYSHDVNVKLRARGGVEHQYRMSAAYPDATKPVEYIYNDPQHVKPTTTAAQPIESEVEPNKGGEGREPAAGSRTSPPHGSTSP